MDTLPYAVTVHRFAADQSVCDQIAGQLTALFHDRQTDVDGLRDAIVLVAYGAGEVAVIAGWDSREAQVAGVARLRSDPTLQAITDKAGFAEHTEYRVVSRS